MSCREKIRKKLVKLVHNMSGKNIKYLWKWELCGLKGDKCDFSGLFISNLLISNNS